MYIGLSVRGVDLIDQHVGTDLACDGADVAIDRAASVIQDLAGLHPDLLTIRTCVLGHSHQAGSDQVARRHDVQTMVHVHIGARGTGEHELRIPRILVILVIGKDTVESLVHETFGQSRHPVKDHLVQAVVADVQELSDLDRVMPADVEIIRQSVRNHTGVVVGVVHRGGVVVLQAVGYKGVIQQECWD
jgi:hypothetical protein